MSYMLLVIRDKPLLGASPRQSPVQHKRERSREVRVSHHLAVLYLLKGPDAQPTHDAVVVPQHPFLLILSKRFLGILPLVEGKSQLVTDFMRSSGAEQLEQAMVIAGPAIRQPMRDCGLNPSLAVCRAFNQ